MRWNIAMLLQMALLMLLAAPLLRAEEVAANDLGVGLAGDFVASEDCHGDCGLVCACESEPRFSANANLLWLGRGKVDPNFLIAAPANAPAISLLHTSELDFSVAAGIEVAVRAERRNGHAWELRYFGIYDQLANERRLYNDGDLDGTNDAAILHFNGDLGSYTDLTTTYASDLQSGELNVWLSEWWGCEPVMGFRWWRQSEDLETYATMDLTEASLIEFSNNLYGGQAGLRRVLWQTPDRCRVDVTVKGGVYYNDMTLDSEVRTLGATFSTFDESFSSTAFGGEINITALYRFNPSVCLRLGYTGLWLDGVGLAANQLDNFDVLGGTGNVDLTTLIYQGGHLGLEFTR